jgi:hypothetical protein
MEFFLVLKIRGLAVLAGLFQPLLFLKAQTLF